MGVIFKNGWWGAQSFPYWGIVGTLPTSQKFTHPPPHKIPPPNIYSPYQRLNSPIKSQFSCYNPIKASFLAVAIAPVPFLFNFIVFAHTQITQILILINVQYLQNVVFSFEKGSTSQTHSFSDSYHPIKKIFPLQNFPFPPMAGRISPTHYAICKTLVLIKLGCHKS